MCKRVFGGRGEHGGRGRGGGVEDRYSVRGSPSNGIHTAIYPPLLPVCLGLPYALLEINLKNKIIS